MPMTSLRDDPNSQYITLRVGEVARYLAGEDLDGSNGLPNLNEALEAASIEVTKGGPDQEIILRVVRSV